MNLYCLAYCWVLLISLERTLRREEMGLSDSMWISMGGNFATWYAVESNLQTNMNVWACACTHVLSRASTSLCPLGACACTHVLSRASISLLPSVRPRSDTKGVSFSQDPVWHRADNSVNLNTTTRLIKIHTHCQQITFYTIIKSLHNRNFSFKWV